MARIRVKKIFLYFAGLVVLFVLYLVFPDTLGTPRNQEQMKLSYTNIHFKNKQVKRILQWTPMFEQGTIIGDRKCLETCSAKCEITDNKSEIENVDAVEFHLSDIWTKRWRIGSTSVIEFPQYRTPDQVWILGNMEPPPHLWGNIRILNGKFNWTKWYRNDADILWPYGEVREYNKTEQVKAAATFKDRNFHKEKSKEILVRISNCFDPGQRYRIIDELETFIHVEKYGKCYNKICGETTDPTDSSCVDLMKKYKFYLAFENDYCRDYVTEKYWHTLERNQIPIVNWKEFDRAKFIPNSYINIFDFDSIEHLAQYLKHVSINETLYNSYFKYKKLYTNQRSTCNACSVCHALHDQTRPAQVYTDIDGWVADDTCDKVGVSLRCVFDHSVTF